MMFDPFALVCMAAVAVVLIGSACFELAERWRRDGEQPGEDLPELLHGGNPLLDPTKAAEEALRVVPEVQKDGEPWQL